MDPKHMGSNPIFLDAHFLGRDNLRLGYFCQLFGCCTFYETKLLCITTLNFLLNNHVILVPLLILAKHLLT